jgi:isocitrate dehydrogenase kinase/phosphatase
MPADRAELPALEPVNIRKCPASRAPDDEVHGNALLSSVPIKIYRRFRIIIKSKPGVLLKSIKKVIVFWFPG